MYLFQVEGYGGEYESHFIHVVAFDEVDAERKAREQLNSDYYPWLATNCITEVDGYKIILEEI